VEEKVTLKKMERIEETIHQAKDIVKEFQDFVYMLTGLTWGSVISFLLTNVLVKEFLRSALNSFAKFTLAMTTGVVDLSQIDQGLLLSIWILLFLMVHHLPFTMRVMNILTWCMICRMNSRQLDVAVGTVVVWILIFGSMAEIKKKSRF
jgi:small-conductance mechanosensitive channel